MARMGDGKLYEIIVGKPEEKRAIGDLSVDGRTLLKWILEMGMYGMRVLNGINWFTVESMAGFSVHVNEPLVLIKTRNFFDQMNYYKLFKEEFGAWI